MVDTEDLSLSLAPTGYETAFTDKVLARDVLEKLRNLIKKHEWERHDVAEFLYLLVATEVKLANFNAWDRYLIGKFYAWTRDVAKKTEDVYEVHDKISRSKELPEEHKKEINKVWREIKREMVHATKFLGDVFLYLVRSSLSVYAHAFDSLTTARYEYQYTPTAIEQPSGWWNIFRRRV